MVPATTGPECRHHRGAGQMVGGSRRIIRVREPWQRTEESMSGPAGSPKAPFVGREPELAALEERLEAVGRGEGAAPAGLPCARLRAPPGARAGAARCGVAGEGGRRAPRAARGPRSLAT